MISSTNINTTIVMDELGINTHNVSELCTSDRINMWSLRKPIAFAKSTGLTDLDYLDANYGFIITSQNNYSSLRTAITNKQGWRYDKPTGGANAPYRLGDFRGYDHRATELFPLTINGSARIDQSVQIICPTDLASLTRWGEWLSYQGTNMQSLNAGFYVPSIGYFPLTDTDQGLTIADLDSEKLSILLSSSAGFTVGRSYEVYLILTTWDGRNGARKWYTPSDAEGGNWWYLPQETAEKFTILKKLTPLDYVVFYISGASCELRYAGDTMDPVFSNVEFTCEVGFKSDYTGAPTVISVTFEVNGVYSGSGTTTTTKTIGTMRTPSIGGGQTHSQYISYSNDLRFLTDRDHLTVTVIISLASGYSEDFGFAIDPS